MTRNRDRGPRPHHNDRTPQSQTLWLWGAHAVRAALKNPSRKCLKLLISQGVEPEFEQLGARRKVPIERCDPATLSRNLPRDSVHQGVAVSVLPLAELDLHEAVEALESPKRVVLLDQVSDPHNLGAILRSAAAFGAGAVIVQDRHSPHTSGILAKSASGALEIVPLVRVVNIARTLEQLEELGFLRLAFDDEAESTLQRTDLNRDVALVLGSEGEGLRRLTKEKCDVMVRLPTNPKMPSLNVSNAAAVALYACKISANERET